jgi:hypothetical protein
LSTDVIGAFKTALGIASPSRLTRALAHWLFDGLRDGIIAGDAAFDAPELTNVERQIATRFTEAIKNATTGAEIDDDIFTSAFLNQLPSHIKGILTTEGGYNAYIGSITADDYLAQNEDGTYVNAEV